MVAATARPGAVLEIDGADYHYLIRVLRLGPGAVIPVSDGADFRAPATVTEVGAAAVRLQVAAEPDARPSQGATAVPGLTLIQALPKGALMDRIVRQATELRAARVVPVVAARTQGRADRAAQARRRQRWQRIARQAAQQSGAAAPAVDAPVALCKYLAGGVTGNPKLVFLPGAEPLLPDRAIGEPPPGSAPFAGAVCAVGPEGGFSRAEEELFRRHGFRAVGLPAGVLRVDTAAVAALTAAAQFLLSARR